MKFILGKKQKMTQYFAEDGKVSPVTIVKIDNGVVTQVKTKATDGYTAIQVGFGNKKENRLSKALLGHLKGNSFAVIKEFRVDESLVEKFPVGTAIDASVFSEGDIVSVSGISKGKGFQGVVKRHGFAGGRRTHGQKHSEREPGSIGGGLRTRVPKGMRMAGRMGSDLITVKNLMILNVDKENGVILIKGALPGRTGTNISIISK